MNQKTLVAGLAFALASSMAFAAPTAVTVNGKTITAAEQEKVISQIVKSGQKRTPELEMQVRNQLIQQEVLLQEANRLKLANRSEVKQAIENARETVLINALIADYAKKNPVKDADVKKFYEEQKKIYGDKEYKVSIITVKTEADAKKVTEDLKDGDKFADVAKKYSVDTATKDKGGKIDTWASSARFPQMIGYAVRNLDKGDYTEVPVRANGLFYVIRVDDTRKAQLFPEYEKSKAHYRNMLVQTKVQENIQQLFQKAKINIGK
ncbi:MAG TPA: peptidyl-prolyl cis-trans isomerase [Candidatus Aphodousia gallistercoris]|nr:peptidyl-prolyl cis-trans isomerase [Candidatus Aphodousia gallistercoris]